MKKSVRPLIPAALLCLLLCLMLLHADYVIRGAENGLILWYSSVVPALFPFMVLSGMIVAGGGIAVLTSPFYFLLHRTLKLTRPGCYVLIAGLLCGYPMGAKTCGDFIREGRISLPEGKFLMAVCNHPSPMFILGFVYPLLQNRVPLPVLLISIYGPVLLLASAAMVLYPHGEDRTARTTAVPVPVKTAALDETIMNAIEILCKIGGYLILFSIAIVFFQEAEAIPQPIRLFLAGSMEMTTGIRETVTSLAFPFSGAAACAALTFGGFSGLFQTKAVIADEKKAGLSIRHYFLWKALHSALSFWVFLLLTALLPSGPHALR